jgi:hypothetical protein
MPMNIHGASQFATHGRWISKLCGRRPDDRRRYGKLTPEKHLKNIEWGFSTDSIVNTRNQGVVRSSDFPNLVHRGGGHRRCYDMARKPIRKPGKWRVSIAQEITCK